MPVRRSIPPAAPRAGRRDDNSQKETPAQRKARILARAEELGMIIRRGETPDEILDKGQALVELKKLAPWELDGHDNFKRYAPEKLLMSETRANEYIRIYTSIDPALVRGTLLCFKQLLEVAKAPQERHRELVAAALAGASSTVLERMVAGNENPGEPSPQERVARLVRQALRTTRELRLLKEQGEELPAALWRQLTQEIVEQTQLIQELGGSGAEANASAGAETNASAAADAERPGPPSPPPSPPPGPPPSPPAQQEPPQGPGEQNQGDDEEDQDEEEDDQDNDEEDNDEENQDESDQDQDQDQDREPAGESIADLCEDYEPEPVIEQGLGMTFPEEWPPDWYEQWIRTSPAADSILLCANGPSPQYGTLGRTLDGAHRLSVNLNGSFCGHFYSNSGGGKTYACDCIIHMALVPLPNVNHLIKPLCAVQLHYHQDDSHEPEALSMRFINHNHQEVRYLIEEMGSLPRPLEDIALVCFPGRVALMRQRHPHVRVFPLVFDTAEITTPDLECLLGLTDLNDDRLYVRQLRQGLRGKPARSLGELEQRLLEHVTLAEGRKLVQALFTLLGDFICDGHPLRRLRQPGRLIIVDTRDPTRSKQEALTVGTLGLSVLTRCDDEQDFNMIVRVDEVQEYLGHAGFRGWLGMVHRKRRHLRVSPLISSQYPDKVPPEMLGNADLVGVGRMQSEEALRHIARVKAVFAKVKAEQTANLQDGEMLLWAEKVCTDEEVVGTLAEILEIQVRSQNAQHGGATRLAVEEDDEDEEE